jgi:hypothetical protein
MKNPLQHPKDLKLERKKSVYSFLLPLPIITPLFKGVESTIMGSNGLFQSFLSLSLSPCHFDPLLPAADTGRQKRPPDHRLPWFFMPGVSPLWVTTPHL